MMKAKNGDKAKSLLKLEPDTTQISIKAECLDIAQRPNKLIRIMGLLMDICYIALAD